MFTSKTCDTQCLFSCWIACVLVNYKNYTTQKAEFLVPQALTIETVF